MRRHIYERRKLECQIAADDVDLVMGSDLCVPGASSYFETCDMQCSMPSASWCTDRQCSQPTFVLHKYLYTCLRYGVAYKIPRCKNSHGNSLMHLSSELRREGRVVLCSSWLPNFEEAKFWQSGDLPPCIDGNYFSACLLLGLLSR